MMASATRLGRRPRQLRRAEVWVALALVTLLAFWALVVVVVSAAGPLVLWHSSTTTPTISGTSTSISTVQLGDQAVGPRTLALYVALCAGLVAGCAALWSVLLARATGRRVTPVRLHAWQLAAFRLAAVAAVVGVVITVCGATVSLGMLAAVLLQLYPIDCYARTAQESGQWLFIRPHTS
jgi:hypothetical protein